jgi:glycolate oxidase FAD binding subunit
VRDYVLGARLLASDGRVLRFGGEVMKNVAGYDVSRLLAGSLGILGVILDVSLKVLPVPAATCTLRRRIGAMEAIEQLASATRRGVPVTGSFWHEGVLDVRLEGSEAALDAGSRSIGGDRLCDAEAEQLWRDVREQSHSFFAAGPNLWRVTASARTPMPSTPDRRIAFEWNGTQRWAVGDDALQALLQSGTDARQATLFRARETVPQDLEVFPPLPDPLLHLHRAVKAAFDPRGIFNPGRMYRTL